MQKLLIAVRSPALAGALERALDKEVEITICHKGADALDALQRLRPDGLIVQLELDAPDGLTVLQQCRRPAATLVLTTLVNRQVLQQVGALGADAMVLLPCKAKLVAKQMLGLLRHVPAGEG